MYIYGNKAHIQGDAVHNEIVDSITEMERLRNPVLLGFVIFWTVWIVAAALAGMYFWPF